jgi:hypothetical protein
MLRSLCLSSFSLLALAGCPGDDESCGPGDAPAAGLTLTVEGETVAYGAFTASVNNDCTIDGAGVISVSVHGTQTGGASPFTLCLSRPDLLGPEPVALVPSRVPPMAGDRAMLIDASAALAGGCTVVKDPSASPAGTAAFHGYCGGGSDPAGYGLEVTGTVPLVRTCGADVDNVTGTLAGTVAVALQ